VEHFLQLTNELYHLRRGAPEDTTLTPLQAQQVYYGNDMTQAQLQRMIPGFIRVEATLPRFRKQLKEHENGYAQIPVDYDWNATHRNLHVDPSVCCHVSEATTNDHIPWAPTNDHLHFWETSIDVLGVRKLPERAAPWDWILLQAGNEDSVYPLAKFVIGDYWSGRDHGYFGTEPRPDRTKGRYLNNQGGWMATRRQIKEWHTMWCRGGFLPPYDKPTMPLDGLDSRSVEYWSGGVQIAGIKSCNLQRVITLDPDGFSRHLLYHTSNNKQRAPNVRHRFSTKTVDQFWGQLNTVRKNAEARMIQELQEKK
jgi:hypothetical protein